MPETEVRYSRAKRWLSMHGKEFNPDGTLKAEVRAKDLANGMNPLAIDDYEARLKAKLEEWKRLDETDPLSQIEYSAYEVIFTPSDREKFDESGSLLPEYIEKSLRIGIRESFLREEEAKMKKRIDSYNKVSERQAKEGINFGESQLQSQASAARTYNQRARQMARDLRNGEDRDSLPFDPDWFYNS
jgi:hypothetical protein